MAGPDLTSASSTALSMTLNPPLEPEEIWWDPALFLRLDPPDPQGPSVFDVMGRARCLFFGPYLPLAAGVWRARVWLEICRDAARRPMAIQFGAEPDYSTIDLPFDRAGPLVATVEHPMDGIGLAQIRLLLQKAAFHGQVRLLGAAVSRIADRVSSSGD